MIRIKLFCASGMSTSVLVKKIQQAAKDKGIEAEVAAFPESQMSKHVDSMDVALLGPQVAYRLANAKKVCEPHNIPVEVIPMLDYGMMNGTKVLDLALKLVNKQ